jgi:hypothetical protein
MYIVWNVLVGVLTLLLPVKIFQTVYILCSIMFLSGLAFGGILGLLVIFTVDLLYSQSYYRRDHVFLRYLHLFEYSDVLHILCCGVVFLRLYPV